MSEPDYTEFDNAISRVEYDLDLYRDGDDDSETPEEKRSELIASLNLLADRARELAEALSS